MRRCSTLTPSQTVVVMLQVHYWNLKRRHKNSTYIDQFLIEYMSWVQPKLS